MNRPLDVLVEWQFELEQSLSQFSSFCRSCFDAVRTRWEVIKWSHQDIDIFVVVNLPQLLALVSIYRLRWRNCHCMLWLKCPPSMKHWRFPSTNVQVTHRKISPSQVRLQKLRLQQWIAESFGTLKCCLWLLNWDHMNQLPSRRLLWEVGMRTNDRTT